MWALRAFDAPSPRSQQLLGKPGEPSHCDHCRHSLISLSRGPGTVSNAEKHCVFAVLVLPGNQSYCLSRTPGSEPPVMGLFLSVPSPTSSMSGFLPQPSPWSPAPASLSPVPRPAAARTTSREAKAGLEVLAQALQRGQPCRSWAGGAWFSVPGRLCRCACGRGQLSGAGLAAEGTQSSRQSPVTRTSMLCWQP